jgi:dihydroorotate dehydrogenase electron transfer subunit
MTKALDKAKVLSNENLIGDYFLITFSAEFTAKNAKPGQFVHVQIPQLNQRILRRPFSIYNTDPKAGTVSVVYKRVGEGTSQLSQVPVGAEFSVMGPLGIGFSDPLDKFPIIVAGGYGCAATYMQAKLSDRKGICIIGGRSAEDLLLLEEFAELGYEVCVSTNDGSRGTEGFVTTVLQQILEEAKAGDRSFSLSEVEIYSCGPNAMLKAVGDLAAGYEIDAEISVDEHMCCGVGACFTCVCKEKTDKNADGWRYSRTCNEGPVYRASKIFWD